MNCLDQENIGPGQRDFYFAGFGIRGFNSLIRADLHPLTDDDMRTDLRFGFFRDGTGGLVSPLYPLAPVASAGSSAPGHLVQTRCLFVGEELGPNGNSVGADELRLNWEVVAEAVGRDRFSALFDPAYPDIGMCSLSDPELRILFRGGGHALDPPVNCKAVTQDGSFAGTITEGHAYPLYCFVGHYFFNALLESVAPATGEEPGADGVCPAAPPEPAAPCFDSHTPDCLLSNYARADDPDPGGHFSGSVTAIDDRTASAGGAFLGGGWSVCGLGIGITPSGDASYRLTRREPYDPLLFALPHWFEPTVLKVKGDRTIVRPATLRDMQSGLGRYTWHTAVLPVNGEGPTRWGENFTPSVVVNSVQVVSRDARGGDERVERPDGGTLKIIVPNGMANATSLVTCTGTGTAADFKFTIDHDCQFPPPDANADLRRLTPTYAVGVLTHEVSRPIEWEFRLPQAFAGSGRQGFLRFGLHASATPAAFRISPALVDFGGVQVSRSAQATVTLENIGGQALEVQTLELRRTHTSDPPPGDVFSFLAVGDPVPMPLPIEAKSDGNGGTVLRWSEDAAEAAILDLTSDEHSFHFSLGDPAAGPDQPVTLYGQSARLVRGTLLRDDPAAYFVPRAASDPRPFALDAFVERKTPFRLAAGETAHIQVTGLPGRSGQRTALLCAEAVEVGRPTVHLRACGSIVMEGLVGPQLAVAPSTLVFTRSTQNTLVVHDTGLFDLQVTRLDIVGRDAGQFALHGGPVVLPFVLAPAGYRDVRIDWTPVCNGNYATNHEASLVIESNGGRAVVPLVGASYNYCELN